MAFSTLHRAAAVGLPKTWKRSGGRHLRQLLLHGRGILLSWESDPGPEHLAGYRLERARHGSDQFETVVDLTRETSHRDPTGEPDARYRLTAINGLGQEVPLGETMAPAAPRLAVWPSPYRGGMLSVFVGGSGGGDGSGAVSVKIYAATGRLVRTLSELDAGHGGLEMSWDGRDDLSRDVPNGLYFVRSERGGETGVARVVVAR